MRVVASLASNSEHLTVQALPGEHEEGEEFTKTMELPTKSAAQALPGELQENRQEDPEEPGPSDTSYDDPRERLHDALYERIPWCCRFYGGCAHFPRNYATAMMFSQMPIGDCILSMMSDREVARAAKSRCTIFLSKVYHWNLVKMLLSEEL